MSSPPTRNQPAEGHQPNDQRPRSNRAAAIRIRWTADEVREVKQRAAIVQAEVSEYVRAAALGQKPKRTGTATGERRALIDGLAQLGKVGSNLNQIARHLNSGGSADGQAIMYALAELASVQEAILTALIP